MGFGVSLPDDLCAAAPAINAAIALAAFVASMCFLTAFGGMTKQRSEPAATAKRPTPTLFSRRPPRDSGGDARHVQYQYVRDAAKRLYIDTTRRGAARSENFRYVHSSDDFWRSEVRFSSSRRCRGQIFAPFPEGGGKIFGPAAGGAVRS